MKHIKLFILSLVFLTIGACAQKKENDVVIKKAAKDYMYLKEVNNIESPWGFTWLPDGSMLITEKKGELIHFKDGKKIKIKNVPKVYLRGQGGLLDIALHPDYKKNGWIYLTYSSSIGKEKGGNTTLSRAKLTGDSLTNLQVLYKATPNTMASYHFGSRITFDNEGYLYFSVGERGNRDVNPQDINRDGGKIYRLNANGTIPKDNPFVNKKGAKKAIYSYGHRNPQGMVKHPVTGEIWTHEHGPKGGDEINIIKKGANYGWPVITYGINYSGTKITDEKERVGMEQPLYYWVPSIAPSGMEFVTSALYPELKNNLLIGSLKFQYMELLKLNEGKVVERVKLLEDIGRVRNIKQGPDGYIYVGVEYEGIFKLVPRK